jgi:steroid 5-alpha reductase family enzyme
MEPHWQELTPLLATNFGIAIIAVLFLWLASIPLRDVSIIDMFFPAIVFAITGLSYFFGNGAPLRKTLVMLLVGIWAVRLMIHLVRRNWGQGEDPRYTKLRSWTKDDRSFVWFSLRMVFLMQGVVIWFVSLPVQFAQSVPVPATLRWTAIIGITVSVIGLLFESVADMQLTRFRSEPENEGRVLQTGLWKYSRHPNYFGELCVWWGIFLIACDSPIGLVTIIGPLIYPYLIINVTGQRTLDNKLLKERSGYRDYMDSTSGIVPMPRRNSPPESNRV